MGRFPQERSLVCLAGRSVVAGRRWKVGLGIKVARWRKRQDKHSAWAKPLGCRQDRSGRTDALGVRWQGNRLVEPEDGGLQGWV